MIPEEYQGVAPVSPPDVGQFIVSWGVLVSLTTVGISVAVSVAWLQVIGVPLLDVNAMSAHRTTVVLLLEEEKFELVPGEVPHDWLALVAVHEPLPAQGTIHAPSACGAAGEAPAWVFPV